MLPNFNIIFPELALTTIAVLTQLFAVCFKNKNSVFAYSSILLTILVLTIFPNFSYELTAFNNAFVVNPTIKIYKILVLLFTIFNLVAYCDYCNITGEKLQIEFITLILLSTTGICIAISAQNFLLLFSAIELTALISYVLTAFRLHDVKSSEGALKYFILGSLVSCLSLLGISFIYGFGGSLDMLNIAYKLNNEISNLGLIVGMVLFLSSLFFKLSSVPMHSWTPDVYEGASIPAVTYFATTTKIGIVAILIHVIDLTVIHYTPISVNLIKIISILSMIFGAIGAINQKSLKRLMAYSTILNMGYVLIGIVVHGDGGNNAAMIYALVYAISTLCFFNALLMLRGIGAESADFSSIEAIGKHHKIISATITIVMFSFIGMPPFAGFFSKYYLFYQAINQKEYLLALTGILASVISAYYYLKVVKTIYFVKKNVSIISPKSMPYGLVLINSLMMLFIILGSFLIPL